jgi:hypothetical protein
MCIMFIVVTRLWTGQLRNHVSIPGLGRNFSVLVSVQAGFGAHLTFYSVRTVPRTMFPGVRVPGSQSHWLHSLRRGSTPARFPGLWVQIPPGAWMSVCCECCVLSGRGLCVWLITRPEKSYRVWCV